MALFTGTVTVIQNNTVLATLEGASLDTGGYERTEVLGNGKVLGQFRKPVAPMVSCKVGIAPDFDVAAINNMEDGVVTFVCDNGPTYQITGAFTTKPVKLTDNGGGAEVEFKGRELIDLS